MKDRKKPLILCILDGYGDNKEYKGNAVKLAKKPNLDRIFATYKSIELITCGEKVGLPDGQMGNSEVGHTNIGAGRIVYQSLTRVNKAIRENVFQTSKQIIGAFENTKDKESTLHILGLFSHGGVHSSMEHLKELIKMSKENNVKRVSLHLFTDGRDVHPNSSAKDFVEFLTFLKDYPNVVISTVGGRYYAMDRDRRWERLEKALIPMFEKQSSTFSNPIDYVKSQYSEGVTDEFIIPKQSDKAILFNDGDSIIMANFRPDRAIQISGALTNPDYGYQYKRVLKNLFYVTMTDYGPLVKTKKIVFEPIDLKNIMGEILEKNSLSQLRIAETEKYPHVTFFFDGGKHVEWKKSKKILIHSPKVATYDLQPEMSAYGVTEALLPELEKTDVIILNFANCDMVGHTGVIPAVVKAVETVDACVGRIYKRVQELDGIMIITADHGNADEMIDENGEVMTKHSLNPVPFVICKKDVSYTTKMGKLADIAPTMLKLIDVEIPKEMTGNTLIK